MAARPRATQAPSPLSVCLQLQNQSELRAPTAEKAAFYLDAALAARSTRQAGGGEDALGSSHMLFTLHVYQYRVEKCGRGGSRWPWRLRGVGPAALPLGGTLPGVVPCGQAFTILPCGFSVWRPQPPAPH